MNHYQSSLLMAVLQFRRLSNFLDLLATPAGEKQGYFYSQKQNFIF
jgi:hypothetical protein